MLKFMFAILLSGSNVLAQTNKSPLKPQSEMQRLKSRQDQALLKGAQEKDLRNELQALELILNNRLRKDGKNELLLRRAFLYFKIGRARLLTDTSSQKTKAQYFKEAIDSVNELTALSKAQEIILTDSQQALLLFIRGSIFQEIGPEKQFIEDFARAIKLDPKLPQSTSMSLIIGETYFDKENYKEALAWYQKLKNLYEPHQKSVADFKSGWAWLLLKEQKNAQFYFLRVANQKKTESFRDEAVRALAFIVAQNRNEAWIVEFAKKSILDESLRLVFLSAVIQNCYNNDKTKVPYRLFSELYKRTKTASAKIKVLSQLITFERREIPTVGQKRAFEYLESLVKKNPELAWREWMKEALDLEADIRGYIQNFSNFYVGKVPTKLDLKMTDVVDILHRQLKFYSRYLMINESQKPTMDLWLDLIHREQNLEMITDVLVILQTIQPLPLDQIERARLEKLAILDAGVREKNVSAKDLIADIEKYVVEFPNSKENTRLLNRLAELYMLDEQFEKALPALQKLQAMQSSEINSYNVVWSLFKLNRFDQVISSNGLALFPKSAKIMDVYRESHLKIAQEAEKNGDDATYQSNLKKYLALNPSQDQSHVVKASLLTSFLKKDDVSSYCQERIKLSDKEKNSQLILETEEQALDKMFIMGPLINCAWSAKKGPASRNFKLILYDKAQKKPLTPEMEKSIFSMNLDQQSIFWSLMAVADPKAMSKVKPPPKTVGSIADLFWLSLQISQNTNTPSIPENLSEILSSRKSVTKSYKTKSSINKIVLEATFPSEKASVDKYGKFLEDLIYRSKLIKTKFQKESPDLADATKKVVLEESAEFERKVAQSIRNSPAPAGLTTEESASYKAELDKAAVDFEKQAEEYDKALGDLKAQMWVQEQEVASERVPAISDSNWFWEGDEFEKLKESFKEYGAFYTLLKLETSRSSKLLTDLDYARRRSGVLLMIRNDDFMRGMIRRELIALGATGLLDRWKEFK
jgi:tetratricopeptide (TPR) repeat protein